MKRTLHSQSTTLFHAATIARPPATMACHYVILFSL